MSSKDTTPTSRPQIPRSASSSAGKTLYLSLYNFVSCILWATVLGRTALVLGLSRRPGSVYSVTGEFVKWTQTLAMVEVLHSVFGIVRAPVLTTAMQVASRFLLVWGIADQFPYTVSKSTAYSTMLLAWSCTEVVRYSYFVFFLNGSVPSALQWLRYNTFFILYPMGIASEMWLVYKSITPAKKKDPMYEYGLWAILAMYIPGSYILYSHMMSQRRRVMRGKQKAR